MTKKGKNRKKCMLRRINVCMRVVYAKFSHLFNGGLRLYRNDVKTTDVRPNRRSDVKISEQKHKIPKKSNPSVTSQLQCSGPWISHTLQSIKLLFLNLPLQSNLTLSYSQTIIQYIPIYGES